MASSCDLGHAYNVETCSIYNN